MLEQTLDARHYDAHDQLIDGRSLHIRAIRPDDKDRLQAGLRSLSPESAYFRFFQAKREFTEAELVYYTEPDFQKHVALIALVDEPGVEHPAGIGRYIVVQHEPVLIAEVAFAVYDRFQGQGVGTSLLRHMTYIGRRSGIERFRASVLPNNRKMLEVFAHSGMPETVKRDNGVVEVELMLPESVSV